MSQPRYPWRRFWARKGETTTFDHEGYPTDPAGKHGGVLAPGAIELNDVVSTPCLVLLGEPGIGKSSAVKDDASIVASELSHADAPLYFDLRKYGSEDRLIRELFQNDRVAAWKQDSSSLYIYMDSVDECEVRHIAAILVDQLQALPKERLRLRIACRTAAWPTQMNVLSDWYPNALETLELRPLRRADVELAANAYLGENNTFMAQLQSSSAVPLAIRPITLNFLLETFKREGALPRTQAELYERGCKLLCEEHSASRRDAKKFGTSDAAARVNLASWIAASMMLIGKRALNLSGNPIQEVDEISAQELCLDPTVASEAALRDLVEVSGLFASRGGDRLGWAHATYQEYLTARFLNQNLSPGQALTLLFHPQAQTTISPRLRQVGAWLGGMRAEFFDFILARDPEVLLASDFAECNHQRREALVHELLGRFERLEALDDNWDERVHYRKLVHPRLAAQLRPNVLDKTLNPMPRRVAINIALACNTSELVEDFLHIVLDQEEGPEIRPRAANAIAHLGEKKHLARLLPLINTSPTEDPDDELRGVALVATYSAQLLSVEQMFAAIDIPRRKTLSGAYKSFLRHVANDLNLSLLPEALSWAATRDLKQPNYTSEGSFLCSILRAAWRHASEIEVTSKLAVLVERRIRSRQDPFATRANKDDIVPPELRHEVALQVLPNLASCNEVTVHYLGQTLLTDSDLPWLLDQFEKDPNSPFADLLARLIASLVSREDDAQLMNRVRQVGDAHDLLRGRLFPMSEAVPRDLDFATELREHHRYPNGKPEPDEQPLDLEAVLEELLVRGEQGDVTPWWEVTRYLQLNPGDTHHKEPEPFAWAITTFPGWLNATPDKRERILRVAKDYVSRGDPQTNDWFDTQQFDSALAGYRALGLIFDADPAWLTSRDDGTIEPWLPIILAYPDDPSAPLTAFGANRFPAQTLRRVVTLLNRESARKNSALRQVIETCWSPEFANGLLKAGNETPNVAVANVILECGLLLTDDNRYAQLGLRLISRDMPDSTSAAERAERMSTWLVLLRHVPQQAWPALSDAVVTRPAVGEEVLRYFASDIGGEASIIVSRTGPDQLAELFTWLERLEPTTPSKGYVSDSSSPTARLRDEALRQLSERGSWECLPALERLGDTFPVLQDIKISQILARRAVVESDWKPVSPGHLLSLTQDETRRFVESGEQLQRVVLESLSRLQQELFGELSPVRDLWDKCDKKWRPIDENELSNRVARHLRSDLHNRGIVVNREVKIRWGHDNIKGQQTDIYVDAVNPNVLHGRGQVVTVIVEVKGCWHRELREAMQTQLLDRYMNVNPKCHNGVFLVGWFDLDQWDSNDSRRDDARRNFESCDAAKDYLQEQATALSHNGKHLSAFVLDASFPGSSHEPKT